MPEIFSVVGEAIDVSRLRESVTDAGYGGVVTFEGVVRERAEDGRDVTGLEYEAHREMAVAEFERIAVEARERFGALRMAIVHRTGALRVGETAVAVVAASEHRGAAFDACEYAIDELKRRAPIWKKERYRDGGVQWKSNACETP